MVINQLMSKQKRKWKRVFAHNWIGLIKLNRNDYYNWCKLEKEFKIVQTDGVTQYTNYDNTTQFKPFTC